MEKLQLTRQQIITLAKNQDNPDLRYEKAFLMHLFGSANNIIIFETLIGWLPYSKRPDGSIYKSDADLAKENGLSTKTIERARKILKEAAFEVYLKKANGVPTNHYRFDLEKFIHFVAKKLNTEIEKVRAWLQNPVRSKAVKAAEVRQTNESASDKSTKVTSSNSRNEARLTVEPASDKESKSLTASTATPNDNIENSLEPTPASEVTALDNAEGGFGSDNQLKLEINRIHSILKIPHAEIEAWIKEYGFNRINNVTRYATESGEVRYPSNWVRSALKNKIPLKSNWKEVTSYLDYTTGRYADFIHS